MLNIYYLYIKSLIYACCHTIIVCGSSKRHCITLLWCCLICQGIKGRLLAHSPRPPDDTAMSSLFSSLFSFFSYSDELTDELQQPYNASLLHIVHNLETDQLKELYFYFTGRISEQTTGYLHILRSLENDGKFSWLDLRSLKEALSVIHRRDLAKSLTKFEIKRDLVILLDFYARMRRGSESRSRSSSVELVAGYLVNLMSEIARDGFDVTNVRSLTETDSRKGITEVLIAFEAEINREMSDPWRRLICLVVIAGEMVGEVLENKELHCRETKVPKLCSMAADMLSTRVIKLGGWVS